MFNNLNAHADNRSGDYQPHDEAFKTLNDSQGAGNEPQLTRRNVPSSQEAPSSRPSTFHSPSGTVQRPGAASSGDKPEDKRLEEENRFLTMQVQELRVSAAPTRPTCPLAAQTQSAGHQRLFHRRIPHHPGGFGRVSAKADLCLGYSAHSGRAADRHHRGQAVLSAHTDYSESAPGRRRPAALPFHDFSCSGDPIAIETLN